MSLKLTRKYTSDTIFVGFRTKKGVEFKGSGSEVGNTNEDWLCRV